MNTQDLNNLIRWAVDTAGKKFAKDVYGKDNEFYRETYTNGKFRMMQSGQLITWIASLSHKSRQNLVDAINNNPTNEKERKWKQ